MSKIDQLRVLFPQFDADILGSILQTAKGELDDAIETLLAMDGTAVSYRIPIPKVEEQPTPLSTSRRTLARKRQRQRQLRLSHVSNRKRGIDKKVKWVRFDPFVTVKEPLKDDNGYRLLTDLPEEEEEVAESWEDIPEKETEQPIDASWQIPQQEEVKLEEDFSCTSNDIPELSSSLPVEEPCEKEALLEDSLLFEITSASGDDDFEEVKVIELAPTLLPFVMSKEEEEEPEESDDDEKEEEAEEPKPVCLLAVKIYFSVYDIRRIPLDRNDSSSFATLAASVSRILQSSASDSKKPFAPKYVDDENEYVTVCSQEEFDECIRVHETCLWPNDGRSMPLLKLYL